MRSLPFVLALSGCSPTASGPVTEYTLRLVPVTASNQDPFSSLQSLTLTVTPAVGSPSSYDLDPISSGSSPEVTDLPALDGAVLSLEGTAEGGRVVSYGRSEPVTLDDGEAEVPLLVTETDRFAWLTSLSAPSYAGAAAADGTGRFLLFGGNKRGTLKGFADEDLSGVYAIDVANPTEALALTEVGQMPALDSGEAGRMLHTATLLSANTTLQGQILVTGGATNATTYLDVSTDAFLWDPSADQATATGAMNEARSMHLAVEDQSGNVVVIGGYGFAEDGFFAPLTSVEIYKPSTGTFIAVEGTSGPMLAAAAASVGDAGVLICGGFDLLRSGDINGSDVCELISTAGVPGTAASLDQPLAFAALAPLGEGRALLTGGLDTGSSDLSQLEPLDATTEAWVYESGAWHKAEGEMSVARAAHGSAPLPDGRVLVFGGITHTELGMFQDAASAIACAEIFDPETETFTPVSGALGTCDGESESGPLPARVAFPAFAADPDYGVAVFGGLGPDSDGGADAALDSATLFVGCPVGMDC